MRDPNRIPVILEALGQVWEQHPDMRLGQLVENVARAQTGDTFYVEDDFMLAELRKWAAKEYPWLAGGTASQ